MPIKKGIFGYDDYNRFGSLIDRASEKGAVNFSYSPKKGILTIMVRQRDAEAVLDCIKDYEVVGRKNWHGMTWIKVKVG